MELLSERGKIRRLFIEGSFRRVSGSIDQVLLGPNQIDGFVAVPIKRLPVVSALRGDQL